MKQRLIQSVRSSVRWRSYRLQTVMVVLVSLALMLLLAGCGTNSGAGAATSARPSSTVAATWIPQDASAAGSGAILGSVMFSDATHGWVVGANTNGPVILATSDSGVTWTAQDASAAGSRVGLLSVDFINVHDGWTVGRSYDSNGNPTGAPIILATRDGGATWIRQDVSAAGSNAGLNSVSFVTATDGWVVGNSYDSNGNPTGAPIILATRDGGATWIRQDASAAGSNAGLNSVSFVSATDGWVVGQDNRERALILATRDGGATWVRQSTKPSVNDPTRVAAILSDVCFTDASHGSAVGTAYDSNGTATIPLILATSDGGGTWISQYVGGAMHLYSVDLLSATDGWAVGGMVDNTGALTRTAVILSTITVGGGVPWTYAGAPGSTVVLIAVDFVNAHCGWAVGSKDGDALILAATR